ncbi:hypothetical protein K5V21_07175 [Clostridium sardiniense]|uniref:Exonuclease domain-containing protein n=1 Tax=Clostridium sardiniense TaxID=29369 RepID=A0ABS7KWN7_CLOSR|nr:3'-5' exonuclease [Clostridium sardiniense]MBY0755234.1 hypothetical protein [Clostridium sardiniense]MDQ0459677.1 DNA polymerase III epsilon subunit-like protein [Clostridium sardiniense]
MKKCSVCSKRGWFLKLKNNLCEECNRRLLDLEEEGERIIEKINNKEIEKEEINEAEEVFRGLKIFLKSGAKVNIDINKEINTIKRYKKNIEAKEKNLKEIKNQEIERQEIERQEVERQDIEILEREMQKSNEEEIKRNKEIVEKNIEDNEESTEGTFDELKEAGSLGGKESAIEENDNREEGKDRGIIEQNNEEGNKEEENSKEVAECIEDKKDYEEERIINDKRMIEMSRILTFKNELSIMESEINDLKNKIDKKNISISNLSERLFKIKDIYLPRIKEISNEGVNSLTLNYRDINKYVEEQVRTLEFITMRSEREIRDSYNYSAICIQTTGKFSNNNSIIEIAAVKVSYGRIIKTFQTYINPEKELQANVEAETGITNKMLEGKPSIRNIMPQFLNFIGSDRLVGYNMGYHLRFIKEEYSKIYGREFFNQELCIMKLYRQKYKERFGVKAEDTSIEACIEGVLRTEPDKILYAYDSKALSTAMAVYKIYENLKN